jgi:hypothetical protein
MNEAHFFPQGPFSNAFALWAQNGLLAPPVRGGNWKARHKVVFTTTISRSRDQNRLVSLLWA